ncbi:DUF3696 domain-containing protein [bacterium SPL81]|nr:DUF3696 domain-containing protein [Acinetobacter baumannii]
MKSNSKNNLSIQELRLENFKIFKKATCSFNKITLLTGANSSGKTSVLNALACIFQSKDGGYPFSFLANGNYVQLGGFRDIFCSNADKNNQTFGIGITFRNYKDSSNINIDVSYRYAPKNFQILTDRILLKDNYNKIEIKWNGQDFGYTYKREVENKEAKIQKDIANKAILAIMDSLQNLNQEKPRALSNKNDVFNLIKEEINTMDDQINKEINIGKTQDELISFFRSNLSFQLGSKPILNEFDDLKRQVFYSGPIRPRPSRQYNLIENIDYYDCGGSNSVQILSKWKSNNSRSFLKIKENLQSLGLATDIDLNFIQDDLAEVKIKRFKNSKSVNISDMGFGISQTLPVLVGVEFAKNNSTILINQPEVHLHPSSQANLANYFVKEQQENNKKFIIETHSEYLINRFRNLIAKRSFSEGDISIIYFDSNENGESIHNISIDKHGRLINAPESFFETYFIDNRELIMASFQGEDDE